MQVLGFEDYRAQAQQLADVLDCPYQEIDIHRFPDGESKVTLPTPLDDEIIICRSLDRPNVKLIELLFSTQVARQQGVKKITLVAPYLCYMRQDIAFHPGEAVSQQIIGPWLGEMFDRVITVDPHLHRIQQLSEAIPNADCISLTASAAMAEFLNQAQQAPVLLGPDEESEQWVKQIAQTTGLEWAVASKQRLGDRAVEVLLPEVDFSGRNVVIVDDMASTGRTMARTAQALKNKGVLQVDALITHPLFTGDAEVLMHDAGIDKIVSTDSISHPSNQIPLAPLIASTIPA